MNLHCRLDRKVSLGELKAERMKSNKMPGFRLNWEQKIPSKKIFYAFRNTPYHEFFTRITNLIHVHHIGPSTLKQKVSNIKHRSLRSKAFLNKCTDGSILQVDAMKLLVIELEKKLKVEPVTEIFKNVTEKTFEHVVEPFPLLSYCTQHFQRDLSMVMFETIFKRCDTRYLKLKLHAFIKLF